MPGHEHKEHRERMKARYAENGLVGFAAHEVLELLLFFAIPQKDVNPLAHRLIGQFGSLSAVLEATPERLMQVPGIGMHTATLLSMIAPIARHMEREQMGERPIVTNYREAKEYCRHLFRDKREEVLYVICMDAQGRVLRAVPAIYGTIDEVAIYPRIVVRAAIDHDAHSVMLAHNHPSGVREPSDADIRTTELLQEVLGGMDIKVLDHIIYADGECTSINQWQEIQRIAPMLNSREPQVAKDKQARQRRTATMQEPSDDGGYESLQDETEI